MLRIVTKRVLNIAIIKIVLAIVQKYWLLIYGNKDAI